MSKKPDMLRSTYTSLPLCLLICLGALSAPAFAKDEPAPLQERLAAPPPLVARSFARANATVDRLNALLAGGPAVQPFTINQVSPSYGAGPSQNIYVRVYENRRANIRTGNGTAWGVYDADTQIISGHEPIKDITGATWSGWTAQLTDGHVSRISYIRPSNYDEPDGAHTREENYDYKGLLTEVKTTLEWFAIKTQNATTRYEYIQFAGRGGYYMSAEITDREYRATDHAWPALERERRYHGYQLLTQSDMDAGGSLVQYRGFAYVADMLYDGPYALNPADYNVIHYEIPLQTNFFERFGYKRGLSMVDQVHSFDDFKLLCRAVWPIQYR